MKKEKRVDSQRIFFFISIICLICVVLLFIKGMRMGLFTSAENLSEFLAQFGAWAWIAFIVLQIVQVIIPIAPGGVTLAAGVLIFGPVYGCIYNYIGICTGSIISFLIVKKYGKRFILKIVNEKTYAKYESWIEEKNRFNKIFTFAILFPFAPDDLLCMLAGLTDMSLKRFATIILLAKPLPIIIYSVGLGSLLQWIAHLFG